MSGIVGVINLDGAAVDPALLRVLLDKLSYRGPDAQATWYQGQAGFGHALLATTFESERERQPSTLDGEVWITADARVDARAQLRRELSATGHEVDSDTTDDGLILHAYDVWGEGCLEHLLGDFAFAIWDSRRRRLFCARDHLGVKPFFYARAGASLVFASELNCVRQHPATSDALDDLAVADNLMFGWLQEPDATIFADIRRLPPGHSLSWSDGVVRLRRYWQLHVPPEARHRDAKDYVDQFHELVDQAVSDRLRTGRAAVSMSGGLDSTIIAAAAKEKLVAAPGGGLRAFTVVYDSLIPDRERQYAAIAADALGIPVSFLAVDDYPLFGGSDNGGRPTPEPPPGPQARIDVDLLDAVATHGRIVLAGWDGDSLCYVWFPGHFRALLRSMQLRRAFSEAAWFVRYRRSIPPIGLRTRLRRGRNRAQAAASFPPWLRPELVAALGLHERWERVQAPVRPPSRPAKADAVELLNGCGFLSSTYDPAVTGALVEARHPLLDLRLVSFALSLPPIPWCPDKRILREVARRRLPATIYERPKAPLSADPVAAIVRRSSGHWFEQQRPSAAVERYVTLDALPDPRSLDGSSLLRPRLLVTSLDLWLRQSFKLDRAIA